MNGDKTDGNLVCSLENEIVTLLSANKLKLTTVESCTGGMLAARIINVSGASAVFESGYITYSNEAKHSILGVKKGTLKKFGAVSEEVAREMAEKAAKISKTNCALSTTGIAGPTGGTKEKPVGTVYISCVANKKTVVKKYFFTGNRSEIRESTVIADMELLKKCIYDLEIKETTIK